MKIAVLGGGVSGLVAAHLLHPRHDVRLFEAAPTLGGHTYTVDVDEDGKHLPIDMGFIVHNDRNYPNFTRLMEQLGVEREPSSMTFSVRCDATGLEYNGTSLNQIFAQRSNLLRPSFYRMLLDILRFHREALELLDAPFERTIAEFLEEKRYSKGFIDNYLVPMTAAIWSTDPALMPLFPARTMAHFLYNHGMLTVDDRPQWKVLRGGSRTYVDKIAARLGERAAVSSPVEQIRRVNDESGRVIAVEVKLRDASLERFDQVVLAMHSDQALRLLADPSPEERAILGAIPYQANECILHTDASLLPRRRRAWASWNYHRGTQDGDLGGGPVRLSYYMNELQNLEAKKHYLVTLNRREDIADDAVLHKVTFHHPLFTTEGCAAQNRWAEISGVRRTHYCGAYWGWGFHEDGVRSALRVCEALGTPW